MRLMGIEAIYPKPRTTCGHPGHKLYPYLLNDLAITRYNQVLAADITYIPISRGFMYLVFVMGGYSRKMLSWRIANTMESGFCIQALQETLSRFDRPDIFNTDKRSQFSSRDFTDFSKNTKLKSAWMVAAAARTAFSLSSYSGPSSTSTFICTLLKTAWPCDAALQNV